MPYRLLTACAEAEAYLIVGALRCEGIDARVERSTLGAIYGLTFGAGASRVLVADEDYAAAADVLNQAE